MDAPIIHSHETHGRTMTEYEITMSSGETVYVLAADLEEAAWLAFELSKDMDATLKDVIPTDVRKQKQTKEEILPKQHP